MFKLNLSPFFAPEQSGTPSIENKELSKEDMIKFMEDDDEDEKPLKLEDKKEEKKEDKDEDVKIEEDEDEDKDKDEDKEKDDEDEEDDEDEDEDTEKLDDEKLELMTPVRKKEILAKYPSLFKDFPYLEVAYYRDKQFSEILPTIDDAKAAVEKSNILDAFENDLLNGDTQKLLTGLKESNPESLNKLIDNFLPTLSKVDSDAYIHIIGSVIKNTIISMAQEAKRLGSENGEPLQTAALLLNQFVFGKSEFEPPTKLSKGEKKDEREEKILEREKAFVQRQYDNAKNSLSTSVDNALKATIQVNIDPKNSMTDYVKKTAIRDAHERLNSLMEEDVRFKAIIDKLWEGAFKSDFSKESVGRIRSAWLSKAKTLLPEVIKKARNEALKGMGKRVSDDSTEETTKRKSSLSVGKSASSSSSGKSVKEQAKAIPRNMRSIDFLMQD